MRGTLVVLALLQRVEGVSFFFVGDQFDREKSNMTIRSDAQRLWLDVEDQGPFRSSRRAGKVDLDEINRASKVTV